jgi:hypothetical protein
MLSQKKPTTRKGSAKSSARMRSYRSGLEKTVAEQIKSKGIKVVYEDPNSRIAYVQPAKDRTYTPDFVLPNGIIVETKGRFVLDDRNKHLWIRDQFGTQYDIRFVFSNSKAKLYKGAKTSYADWCIKHKFLFADKEIPEEWFNE